MTDEQFRELSGKLDALNENLSRTHAEEFEWAKAIIGQQQSFGNRLGLDTTPREFIPYYNPLLVPSPVYPEVFNKYGERMEFFFISDRESAHVPNERNSRYIIWDRYNYGIETHFYTHDEIFRTVGKPKRKYGVLIEPKTIKPQSYENILKYRDYVEKNFDMLFTYDAQVLNNVSNAKFVPFPAAVWYGTGGGGRNVRCYKIWSVKRKSIHYLARKLQTQDKKYFDDFFGKGSVPYAHCAQKARVLLQGKGIS